MSTLPDQARPDAPGSHGNIALLGRAIARRLDAGARQLVRTRLGRLRGGTIAVRDPWGDWHAGTGPRAASVRVHDGRFYRRLLAGGSVGAAESYLDGDWDTDDLTALLGLIVRDPALGDGLEGGAALLGGWIETAAHRLRRNTRRGSRRNIEAHYDLGDDFFALFLDPSMTYSAGIFDRRDSTLAQASLRKLDHVCRKLELGPHDHVLEIGTGWGSFALHAAQHYGCRVTTTTISRSQHRLARERVRAAGLADRIEVLDRDYRDLTGRYDKLVSIEMVEAVGHAYLPHFFATCSRLLRDEGAMLLQAITIADQRYRAYRRRADFIQRHVFPGSCIPGISALLDAVRTHTDLRLTHLEDIGPHYARTLAAWREGFAQQREAALGLGYPPRLLRLWHFYLCYCEAGFLERYLGDLQLLLEKPGRRAEPLVHRFEVPPR